MSSESQEKNRILVVDDDEASRGLMHIFLSEYGQCDYATNGAEGLEAVAKALDIGEPYDLVCLDVMMPEMDGLECLQKIRETEESHGIEAKDSVKVIMSTAAGQVSKTMKAFHYGCSGYLVKPISKETLTKEIDKLPLKKSSNAQWRGR